MTKKLHALAFCALLVAAAPAFSADTNLQAFIKNPLSTAAVNDVHVSTHQKLSGYNSSTGRYENNAMFKVTSGSQVTFGVMESTLPALPGTKFVTQSVASDVAKTLTSDYQLSVDLSCTNCSAASPTVKVECVLKSPKPSTINCADAFPEADGMYSNFKWGRSGVQPDCSDADYSAAGTTDVFDSASYPMYREWAGAGTAGCYVAYIVGVGSFAAGFNGLALAPDTLGRDAVYVTF